jgi:hypothetical protein
MGISFLSTRLRQWACDISFASSRQEARSFVNDQQFDLVLSEFRLWGDTSTSFSGMLIGTNATLIYSYSVEHGCWWLPAVSHGRSCWGSAAMQPSEFIGFLDGILKEIKSSQAASPVETRAPSFTTMAK